LVDTLGNSEKRESLKPAQPIQRTETGECFAGSKETRSSKSKEKEMEWSCVNERGSDTREKNTNMGRN